MGCTENSTYIEAEHADNAAMRYVLRFCHESHIWSAISHNPTAYSCRDAAAKRRRLGYNGIPLHDELKSYLGRYDGGKGKGSYIAIHCRGDRDLDFDKVKKALGITGTVERLSDQRGQTDADSRYGLVNPFNLTAGFQGEPVLQVFDKAILHPHGLPNTMMTNAGSRTSAIEFRPHELINALGHLAIVADVTIRPTAVPSSRTCIGILTGNPPDSGMLLWQHINRRVQQQLGLQFQGDLSYPPVQVRSVPGLGLSMELDRRTEQVWDEVRPAITSLCQDGVRLLCLACHTSHYFTDRIRRVAEECNVKFISAADVVEDWIQDNQIPELTLVGIDYVASLGKWSAYRNLSKVARVEPISAKGLQRIHELGYLVKQKGSTEAGRNRLRSILNDEARTKHVVIALTEISILLASQRRKGRSGRIIIDALELYGNEIADAYLKLSHPSGL